MSQKRLSCAQCDAPLPNYKRRGKPRRYCSDACKVAAHRRGNTRRSPRNGQKQCQQCGASFTRKGEFCGDACYYQANKHNLPFGKMALAAFDEQLVPWVPAGQIRAFDMNRPNWHAWLYGGKRKALA
jgi:hypothetical protein